MFLLNLKKVERTGYAMKTTNRFEIYRCFQYELSDNMY